MDGDQQDVPERKPTRQRPKPPAAQPAPATPKPRQARPARDSQPLAPSALPPEADAAQPSLLARMIVWGTIAICALLILATISEVFTVHQLNQQVAAAQQQNAQLQEQNQVIATQIAQLQDPQTIEQEARQLGYIYPGDQPVVVVTTQPAPAPAPRASQPAASWWGFWPDWLKLFFGG